MKESSYQKNKNGVVVAAATIAGAVGYKIGAAGFEKPVPAAAETIRIGRAFVKLVTPSSEDDDDDGYYDDEDDEEQLTKNQGNGLLHATRSFFLKKQYSNVKKGGWEDAACR